MGMTLVGETVLVLCLASPARVMAASDGSGFEQRVSPIHEVSQRSCWDRQFCRHHRHE